MSLLLSEMYLWNYTFIFWKCIFETMIHSSKDILLELVYIFLIKYHLRIKMIDKKLKKYNKYLSYIHVY